MKFRLVPSLSITVLGALGLICGACGDRGAQAKWWEGEQERLKLVHELELKQFRYAARDPEALTQMQDIRAACRVQEARIADLREDREDLLVELAEMDRQLEIAATDAVRSRRAATIGHTFDMLSLQDGRRFERATVASVDDAGVGIRHRDGSARLKYSDLSTDQRAFFALDEVSAKVAEEDEAKKAAAYERWVDQQVARADEKQGRRSETARMEEASNRRDRAMISMRHADSDRNRPLAQPATTFGRRGYSSYSFYRSYRPSRYVYYSTFSPSVDYRVAGYSCSYTPVNRVVSNCPPVSSSPPCGARSTFSQTLLTDIP